MTAIHQWHPTPVLLPGISHGWRSLVDCIPWGPYESVTTERLHFHFSLSRNGEGNGNPLQCSCLENPRDAWWAAVCGVAQSRTRLKRLSSIHDRKVIRWPHNGSEGISANLAGPSDPWDVWSRSAVMGSFQPQLLTTQPNAWEPLFGPCHIWPALSLTDSQGLLTP